MTSQINSIDSKKDIPEAGDCRPPENAPTDYCQKLKSGIARLQAAIQAQYQEAFPAGARMDRRRGPRGGKGSLGNTISSAFLSRARTSAGE